jgi:hypothetical protein
VATASRDPNALVLHATVSALDPEVLHSQTEQSVRALLKEGESPNAVRSYASALRYWAARFQLRYRAALTLDQVQRQQLIPLRQALSDNSTIHRFHVMGLSAGPCCERLTHLVQPNGFQALV